MPGSALDRLDSFGAIDAESDFRWEFFVPSTSWENVRELRRPIVIGRKGTGKTALRLALLDEAARDPLFFASDLTFRDYPWNVHNGVFDETVGGKSRYQDTWLFLMLIELAKQVVGEDQQDIADPVARDIADGLRLFVEENWGSLTFDHRDIFRATEYQVTSSFRPQVGGTGIGSVDWTRVGRDRLGDTLSAMNRWLKDTLAYVRREDTIHLLVFDELDLDFARGDEPYADSVIGLLLAAQNYFRWCRDLAFKSAALILLRDDIYRDLNFPDKNKLSMGLVEEIQWDDDFTGSDSLKTLVDTRIRVLLGLDAGEEAWRQVFDDDVMRGTQHKFVHMAQRTYLRPRDMIQFCNVCLDTAKERRSKGDGGDLISNRDVTNSRLAYSGYLRNELADEIHAHYPDWEKWLDALRRIGILTFTREEFSEAYPAVAGKSATMEPDEVLSALYEFSIIGFVRRGGSGAGGTVEYWKYRDPEVALDLDAPTTRFTLG